MGLRSRPIVTPIEPNSGHVGLNNVDTRGVLPLFQFVANSPFTARVYATLNFDFETDVGTNWFDVTHRLKRTSPQDPDFVFEAGTVKGKKASDLELPIFEPGVYSFDPGFVPHGFLVHVESRTIGDDVDVFFGGT